MFVDDLNDLRKLVQQSLMECMNGVLQCEKEFSSERQFFMKSMEQAKKKKEELQDTIEYLRNELETEKS